jgi:dihydroxyacetone kinase
VSHFINDRDRIVCEAIDTEVSLSSGALRRLDGFPAIKVVVRADWVHAKVAVVSGGGAGHEPSHVGFVGDGMLTAAVCGEIFASPSVDAVLASILAVTGAPGCLLVVKNYTGDRLNFGLAAEKARALGVAVEMVIVGDDIALPSAPRRRGIAGTLFVHKVAGHLARDGRSLADVKLGAERAAKSIVSIGVSLSSCSIPGQAPSENRIAEGEVEMGLGIHGEPGATRAPLRPIHELGATMMGAIEDALGARDGSPIALLVNDLGAVPPLEMALATRAALDATKGHDVRLVFGPARLMTALDMKGFSLSAIPLRDPELEEALRSPVAPRAWPIARTYGEVAPAPLPDGIRTNARSTSADPERRRALERACAAVIAQRSDLDALDAKVGDGDTGTTLATAARAILSEAENLPFADPPALFAALSETLSRVMGGSSGVLLAIFTAAVGARLGASLDWHEALEHGVERVQEYGGAEVGDRTMLDALVPAVEALRAGGLEAAARAATEGARRTATMSRAGAGRSSYVREEALRGVPDPGAVAVATVLKAIAER